MKNSKFKASPFPHHAHSRPPPSHPLPRTCSLFSSSTWTVLRASPSELRLLICCRSLSTSPLSSAAATELRPPPPPPRPPSWKSLLSDRD